MFLICHISELTKPGTICFSQSTSASQLRGCWVTYLWSSPLWCTMFRPTPGTSSSWTWPCRTWSSVSSPCLSPAWTSCTSSGPSAHQWWVILNCFKVESMLIFLHHNELIKTNKVLKWIVSSFYVVCFILCQIQL